ncbi:MAG TPA: radical SAM protein [Candidatus Fimivivens faecavium]|nr:radical SAM protein [Candidatus Fimivivens faecavium]
MVPNPQPVEKVTPPLEEVPAKTIVTRGPGGSWFGTDYNMNLYRGCCHGCIYCDSRSSCYGIDGFDRVRVKKDALRIVRDELRRKVKKGVVGSGAMSDPYNPFERELLLTRHSLELIEAYGFGAAVATKGTLVERDIDLFQSIAGHAPVLVKVTVTAADDALAARLEPRAPSSSSRFEAIAALSKAGVFCGVLLMPVLPFLTDGEENIREIVRRAAAAGARFVYPGFGVTLRENQRDWFYDRLDETFPGEGLRARYERRYGQRYSCGAPRLKALWRVFQEECGRLGVLYEMRDIVRAYRLGYGEEQLSLF